MRRFALVGVLLAAALLAVAIAGASTPGADVRLTNDCHPDVSPPSTAATATCGVGYVSDYTLATGIAYTDQTLKECTVSRGRENEPSVAVDPRDESLLLGSSNDYCGVYNRGAPAGAVGPIWLGYYRSQDGGSSFTSSLVPGYPDDASPYASLSQTRTATAGDPVIAWDNHGRAFFGSESSGDPAGSAKTFGDVFVARFRNPDGTDASTTARDGLEYYGSTVVARGSSAPNLLGVFHDKTAIEVDRTGGACDGNVYFSWSRFTGNGTNAIYFSRSTDHGVTFSNPQKITESVHGVQFPDISVTGNGHVYVTFRQFEAQGQQQDHVMIVKSANCGATFGNPVAIAGFIPYDAQDESDPEAIPTPQSQLDDPLSEEGTDAGRARDCGDFSDHCTSGYTFFRRDTQVRSTADQRDTAHEWIYIVYDPSKPGTQTPTGTTYGSIAPGTGSQSGIYFTRYNGVAGSHTEPALIDPQSGGHQLFPDISADGGVLHALWWDSRNDSCYSAARPVGNCANRSTVPSLDVFAATSTTQGNTWTGHARLTDVTSNPNYEQFDNRAVPFAGDYLWVTSHGSFAYGVWTDYRNTVQGTDPREATEDEDNTSADVLQCRLVLAGPSWSGDRCPHSGGIDQDIYGDKSP